MKAAPLAESMDEGRKASAERADPVLEDALSVTATDPEEADTKLAFTTSPAYAVSGETITVTWQLTPGEDLLALGKLEDQTLEIEAPEGLAPLGESASKFDPATRTLSLPLAEQGQVTWQVARTIAKDFTQPLWLLGRILTNQKIFLETPLVVPVAEQFQVESTGGVVKTSQGLVTVAFPEKALPESIDLQIRSPQSQTIASSFERKTGGDPRRARRLGQRCTSSRRPFPSRSPTSRRRLKGTNVTDPVLLR